MGEQIVLQCLQGNKPAALTTLQAKLYPFADTMILLWWCLWAAVVVYMLFTLAKAFYNRLAH